MLISLFIVFRGLLRICAEAQVAERMSAELSSGNFQERNLLLSLYQININHLSTNIR